MMNQFLQICIYNHVIVGNTMQRRRSSSRRRREMLSLQIACSSENVGSCSTKSRADVFTSSYSRQLTCAFSSSRSLARSATAPSSLSLSFSVFLLSDSLTACCFFAPLPTFARVLPVVSLLIYLQKTSRRLSAAALLLLAASIQPASPPSQPYIHSFISFHSSPLLCIQLNSVSLFLVAEQHLKSLSATTASFFISDMCLHIVHC